MKKFVSTFVMLTLVLVVTACGGPPTEVATAKDTTSERLDSIKREVDLLVDGRRISRGWATEVRPGDGRSARMILDGLRRLEVMRGDLEKLDSTSRGTMLGIWIREVMIEDLKTLLDRAKLENNLGVLEEFLRIAPGLDTTLEDFGTNAKSLRRMALLIAKQEVEELRPRLVDGSGDAHGMVQSILQEWQFTPEELGLSPAEAKKFR